MEQRYFYFDREHLNKIATEKGAAYKQASPFPYAVIDDFLPPEVLEEVLAEFPKSDQIDWKEFSEVTQNKKLSCEDENLMGQATRHLLNQFNSSTFVKFLESLTGIENLIPDPHFRGGGWHQTLRGGSLGVHADFNYHKKLKLYRRINVIVYLNKNWPEHYGGHLELWDQGMTKCEARVLPIFNRAVVFNTDNFSNHGQPDPLTCPSDNSRKSLALYYYTVEAPSEADTEHHTTIFRSRPGQDEDFAKKARAGLAKRVGSKIKRLFNKS